MQALRKTGFGLFVLMGLMAIGCQSGFEQFYVPAARDQVFHEVPREQVEVVQTGDQSPDFVAEQLFPEGAMVGRSTFVSGPQSDSAAAKFSGKIGANVVVWSARCLEIHVAQYTRTIPETHTKTVSFTDDDGRTRHRKIEYNTYRTELDNQVVDRYQHDALFLRVPGVVNVLLSE